MLALSACGQFVSVIMQCTTHYHQHHLAEPEASQRYHALGKNSSCAPQSILQNHNVGRFDYECPDAKYIIVSLGGNGLGAHVRTLMVPAYLMGLTANRIVLFVNNVPESKNNKFLTEPWLLASCPERLDYQCFFMPPSPCTLTVDEISNAHHLDRESIRMLTKRSKSLPELDHHKVWSFNSPFLPSPWIGPLATAKLQEYAQLLANAVPNTPDNSHFRALLNKAVEAIGVEDGKREGEYSFSARWGKIYHALTMYSVRPNPSGAAALEQIMEEVIPDNFNPESSLGLPIRGTLIGYNYSLLLPERKNLPSFFIFCF